jgi:hypothetical protein
MSEAAERNREIEKATGERARARQHVTAERNTARQYEERAKRLREEADELDLRAKEIDERVTKGLDELDALPAMPDPIDITPIRAKLEDAEGHNEKVRLRKECLALMEQFEAKQAEHDTLTEAIESRRALRARVIGNAKMPVEGLGFGEGEVLFNELPLDQASGAQQLRVALGIAMAQEPQLRVIRITNGSLLDESSMKIVREMASDRGYQVWIERVDTSGSVGVYLEEGVVRAADREQAEALI